MKNKYEFNFYPLSNVKGMQCHFKKMENQGWYIHQIHSFYFKYGNEKKEPVYYTLSKKWIVVFSCILLILIFRFFPEFTIVFVNGALGIWMFMFFINGIRILCSGNVSKTLVRNYILKFIIAILITALINNFFFCIF